MVLPAGEDGVVAPRAGTMKGRVARSGDTPASNGNVANIVTVARMLLAPAFIWLLLADDSALGPLRYVAAALFIIAIVTDSVDGRLARRRNLVTDFGTILDPIADKVLVGGALVALSVLDEPWGVPWWVTIVVLVREFGITAFRFAVLRRRVIPASRAGKYKTIVQGVAVSLYLVPTWLLVGDWVHVLNAMVMGVALLLTVATGIDYLIQAWRKNRRVA